ncbi:TIGR02186 family protein [Pseudovibrio exalbescens]|uniref:TIGR02186 family protein n=1 Tax=Pseudovibrio exalbescens TaxID=197461 RepID=UPI0023660684|nr:TIGR02186 family protein [Pseudovibrio exalbescens]MDD7911124.1 TIGR02186 family protein [Pseudovibrio exalbescens]
MMKQLLISCVVGFGLAFAAPMQSQAETLVSALSSEEVNITSNFTGTDITVFGEITRDAATVPRSGPYDIVVVVEGPPERVTTWRKERIFGLWINAHSKTYTNVPSFYAVHSTRPLQEITEDDTLEDQRTGLVNLPLAPFGVRLSSAEDRRAFRKAFLQERVDLGLYAERPDTIKLLSPTLFATSIPIPANVPVGEFKVTTFLYNGGVVLSEGHQELTVAKKGFEQFTFDLANENPALYGVIAVILALFTGWLAGVIFRKD